MNKEKLNQENKEAIARAISFYLENYVWKDFASKNNDAASEEYFKLRSVINKLELKMPIEITSRY